MKIEIVKSSFIINERIKVDDTYLNPSVECNLTCRCHSDNTARFIINGIQDPKVMQSIKDRLMQAGYDYDFIINVIYGHYFNVTAKTQLRPEDEYDETIGRHIAETKARTKAFKIVNIITEELAKYYSQANEDMSKMNAKFNYLHEREKNHLNDVFATVVTKGDS
ncbi:hypothetical protein [uncultured Methanobrevibacter sp.]|uniref:hypothetical protein n=1 Tax=uncultured Methanobrevibacter sp. TaxID=253161 RepID=UPI0025CE2265|nr:hypothetical protein [uncultured Methanobrevibacter sp.]